MWKIFVEVVYATSFSQKGLKDLEINVATTKDTICGFMWYLSLDKRTSCILQSTCSALSSKPALFQEVFVALEQLASVLLHCNFISRGEEDT